MKREKFSELLDNGNEMVISFYHKSEIPGVLKMKIDSVEDYDDEFIIRSSNNTFIILSGDPVVNEVNDEEKEYIFAMGNVDVGVVVR